MLVLSYHVNVASLSREICNTVFQMPLLWHKYITILWLQTVAAINSTNNTTNWLITLVHKTNKLSVIVIYLHGWNIFYWYPNKVKKLYKWTSIYLHAKSMFHTHICFVMLSADSYKKLKLWCIVIKCQRWQEYKRCREQWTKL